MNRRKWDAKTKATIVLEGLKGKPVARICQNYQKTQYYPWRDPFLTNAPKTCEVAQQTDRKAHLQRESARLKNLIRALTLELQKSKVKV